MGVLIGDMGCHDANPGTEEVGYMFLDEFRGKGYATEALKAYLDHILEPSSERICQDRNWGRPGGEATSENGEEEGRSGSLKGDHRGGQCG